MHSLQAVMQGVLAYLPDARGALRTAQKVNPQITQMPCANASRFDGNPIAGAKLGERARGGV